ncbi:uncharacterized protein LOC118378286 isoform X6 [Oncorhynchus keta]|uniref:uncharacterized protein LOC118378286 isoform X6 n=1 Tax=Oncorhynchus keta TaxID=8018 RepID=UPI00227B9171|nr:uncharacterized protein LOC118378286 isoform X6 [Oncorhynchus keta]XP_052365068.1 uncharacterized protein LOC118378286 isoform X6 [Oncorhynchus keta]XP_052365069.1 uncharacterized protein LOC118378286 isoform X6 [Oncorhynchus keta]
MTQVRRSVGEALWGMCAADAMSMPAHWYYNIDDIKRDFGGWITGFNAPNNRHPSSILTLSNSAGSGRTAWSSGGNRPHVVGSVILHNKLKFWKASGGSVHYHQGLQAGENTLNAICSLRVAQALTGGKFASVAEPAARGAVLADYVHFMTTPGSHGDTYAESFHRAFFSDWQDPRPTSSSKVMHTHMHAYMQDYTPNQTVSQFVLSMCSRCYVCVSCPCVPGVTFVCLVYVFQVLRLCVLSMCSRCYVCVSCLCVPGVSHVLSMCSRCYVCVSCLCVPGATFVCLVYVFQVLVMSCLCVPGVTFVCLVYVFQVLVMSCLCVPGVTFVCLVYVFQVLRLCVLSMCSRCYVCVSCLCVPGVTFVCLVYVFQVLRLCVLSMCSRC